MRLFPWFRDSDSGSQRAKPSALPRSCVRASQLHWWSAFFFCPHRERKPRLRTDGRSIEAAKARRRATHRLAHHALWYRSMFSCALRVGRPHAALAARSDLPSSPARAIFFRSYCCVVRPRSSRVLPGLKRLQRPKARFIS